MSTIAETLSIAAVLVRAGIATMKTPSTEGFLKKVSMPVTAETTTTERAEHK
jgi:hypothetical protein